jgi:hypothetical protein
MSRIVTWLQISKPILALDLAVFGKSADAVLGNFMRPCSACMAGKSVKETGKNFTGFVAAA